MLSSRKRYCSAQIVKYGKGSDRSDYQYEIKSIMMLTTTVIVFEKI